MPLELRAVATAEFTYAALYRGRELIDLAVDRAGETPLYQSIWQVKIDRYLPDVGTFVALGQGVTGLLRGGSRRSGEELIVQVKSRRSGGKADIVSEDIALTGRGFIYLPNGAALACSRRLPPAQAEPLRTALAGQGITGGIIRSAALGMALPEILAEALALQASWQAITGSATASGTQLAPGPDAATRLATDYSSQALQTRQGTLEEGDLSAAIAALQAPKIELPRGGSVLIEPTAALTAIDVNAGTRPPAEVNREALAVIATQLRLRNLSGLILIDLAGGVAKPYVKQLEKLLADDPAGCRLGGLTPAGLLEITRSRRDLPLAEKLGWSK